MSTWQIILIVAAFASSVALFAWWANRSVDEWRVRHEAAKIRAQQHLESGSAFGEGSAAALQGQEFWDNPYCTPTGPKDRSLAWSAGWCYGRRELRDIGRAEP